MSQMSSESIPESVGADSDENSQMKEEIIIFETHLDENGDPTSVDCQEVLIGEIFEEPTSELSLLSTITENLTCPTCSRQFKDAENLTRHQESHNQRHFKCPQCRQLLKTRSGLASHLQRHRDGKRFECSVCRKCFVAQRDLKNHQETHNPESERFHCKVCGKSFGRIYSLNDHMKLHSGEGTFSCTKCSMIFAKRRNLLLHERSHLVEEEDSKANGTWIVIFNDG